MARLKATSSGIVTSRASLRASSCAVVYVFAPWPRSTVRSPACKGRATARASRHRRRSRLTIGEAPIREAADCKHLVAAGAPACQKLNEIDEALELDPLRPH